MTDWQHISVYNNGKADQIRIIFEHFRMELTPGLDKWLRLQLDKAVTEVEEADKHAAA